MSNPPDTPTPDYRIDVVLRDSRATPSQDPAAIHTLAKTLAGGYVFVAFILTTIGALQGGLERLLLNHPVVTVLGLLLAGAGIGLAFLDLLVKEEDQGLKWALLVLAFFAFAVGVGVLILFSTTSLAENERPGITAEASMATDGSKLEGKVTAYGLKSADWIYLSAKGFQPPNDEDASSTEGQPVLLYQTRAGPDRNGKVDLSFNIPVALGRFSFIRIGATRAHEIEDESIDPCFAQPRASVDQSCVSLYPPHGPKRPTLSATWEKGTDVNVFDVAVKTSGGDPDDVVLLDVSDAKKGTIFSRSMFSGSSTGAVDAEAKVPVPAAVKRVCVLGRTINAADQASLTTQPTKRKCSSESFDLSQTSFAIVSVP